MSGRKRAHQLMNHRPQGVMNDVFAEILSLDLATPAEVNTVHGHQRGVPLHPLGFDLEHHGRSPNATFNGQVSHA